MTSLPTSLTSPDRWSVVASVLQAEITKRASQNRLATYQPYNKQREFHALGKTHRIRALFGGNQLGKTWPTTAEDAMHLTGEYPDWWVGHRFDRPIRCWASGVTSIATRDTLQTKLVGPPEVEAEWGTGWIPKRCLVSWNRAMGTPNLLDNVVIRHKSGGVSTLWFKSYEQGRIKWQGPTIDLVHFDEEPSWDIWSEGMTRTNAVADSRIIASFTPLLGMSEVVRYLLAGRDPQGSGAAGAVTVETKTEFGRAAIVFLTIDDAGHYTEEQRAAIIASYPAHEREARIKGIPALGSGRVFPIAEDDIAEEAIQIPPHWPQLAAFDFGWDHPTAAVSLAWDRDADCVHVTRCYRISQATPLIHSGALKPWGDWLPWAVPRDGLSYGRGGDAPLADQYRKHSMKLLPKPATFEDGSLSVEAGLMNMLERMETGRLKVAKHLADWFEEFRLYHRKDGRVVEEHDDLMDATRYAIMSLRHARPRRLPVFRRPKLGFVA